MANSVSDKSEKGIFDDDKTDSGFISSGNLLISGEIVEESDENGPPDDRPRPDEKDNMFVDSGVILSEDFSKLSLQNAKLNDLGCDTQRPVECASPVQKSQSDVPWEIYYQQDEDGDTHLHTAISNGLSEIALALIRIAPHPRLLDTPNDDAVTPLHLAVALHQWRIVRCLIIAGARPGPRNLEGDSPLHMAARNGDVKCCNAILYPVQAQEKEQLKLSYPQSCPPFDIEQWNYKGQTCAHVAAQYGNVEILQHLIWYGADVNAREGREGYTPLHYAVERNDLDLINFLVNKCEKINLNTTTYGGNSALQLGFPINDHILSMLRQKGIASPYSSEEEYSSDSEDEMYYENDNLMVPNLVNASA